MKHRIVLVMGVAGSGKSTIGRALATAIDAAFLDADDFHPTENIKHMAAGNALTDDMRWPWLDALGDAVRDSSKVQSTVFACSALKRVYRDYLRASVNYRLVYPDAPYAVVAERMAARKKHFMPVRLLRSQYDTLNVPTKDEEPITVDVRESVDDIIASIIPQLDQVNTKSHFA